MGGRQSKLKEGTLTDWRLIVGRELTTWHEHIRTPRTQPKGTCITRVYKHSSISLGHKDATGERKQTEITFRIHETLDGCLKFVDEKCNELVLYHDEQYTIMICGNPERTDLVYFSTQNDFTPNQLEYALKLTIAVGQTHGYSEKCLQTLCFSNHPVVF